MAFQKKIKEDIKIDEKKLQERIGFEPHPGQQEVLKAYRREREILLRCGRRWGKSSLTGYIATEELLKPNKNIFIVAPTYDLASIVFDMTVQWVGKVLTSKNSFKVTRHPTPEIRTAHGSKLVARSADNPVSLLGRSVDLVIMDEAARINEEIWTQYLYPATTDTKGKAVFISTPLGQNWFHDKDKELEKVGASFHFTSKDNPYFDNSEWERAKKKNSDRVFNQEYGAMYISDSDALFRNVTSIIRKKCLSEPRVGKHYIMGLDIARKEDDTVATIIDIDTHEVVFVDGWRDVSFQFQKTKIYEIAKKYNNARIICDSTGMGASFEEELKQMGLYIEGFSMYSSKNKEQLIKKLVMFIEAGAIRIPENDKMISQLRAYQYEITASGITKYSAPGRKHDDYVISLALAVWGLRTSKLGSERRYDKVESGTHYSIGDFASSNRRVKNEYE